MKPPLPYTIRPATHAPADDVAWARLRHELWPDCPPERHAVEKQLYLRSPGIVLFALNEAGEPFGFVEVSVRRDHVVGSSSTDTPYLEGWFIEADYRDRGIGRALIEAACEWARNAGYRELASDTEFDNHDGISAHLRLGFRETERTISFLRPL
ncbi:GNAT family N-acetyltransferase [Actomonas aquatica]|uniref:GNAT family N-acetyltransferase n=1 Tax=Actomonas aquatica TaxID=2866162 RepID=A0ABZ1C1S6_9BACT|nr:GNAT family N-acetyltransferase [Opitutus sp. WL0086]WRQ85587.1 GNAT family N-acetyltransferase [Opitutus sp. WL0086]